jgi:biopolymer transport protein ExbD
MKIAFRSHHATLAELNITPLLDLVFVLLVIFIITTPQLMNNLELALPAGKADPPENIGPTHILVLGHDQIQLEARRLTLKEFKIELASHKAMQSELTVIVEGTDRAEYQAVVDVLEVLQQLNITQVGLAAVSGDVTQNR